jgi:hypothetical protein
MSKSLISEKQQTSASQDPEITREDWFLVYDQFRKYLTHEDDLVNQRTTWAITIQSFSLAAVGWVFSALTADMNARNYYRAIQAVHLIQFFCALGIGVSIISAGGIAAAQTAIRRLEMNWGCVVARSPYKAYFPMLAGGGSRRALWMGHAMPLALPVFLVLLWILLLTYITGFLWEPEYAQ